MPTVKFFDLLLSGFNLIPNGTRTHTWNNAPNNRVISYDVIPFLIDVSPGNWAQVEITRVWRDITPEPHRQRIHITLKNTGGTTINYDVYMAQIGD
jgi:hypothetical protein